MKAARQKKCRSCGVKFQPANSLQTACSVGCAMDVGRKHRRRQVKRETRERRQRLKTRRSIQKEAQAAFNWWVRERDAGKPCISCGKQPVPDSDLMTGSRWDCGHYRSTGANPELRFEPLNAHSQCVECNRNLSGNLVNFRIGLRERIGEEALEWLEGPHEPKRYTREDLIEIRDNCRREARRLKREREKREGV